MNTADYAALCGNSLFGGMEPDEIIRLLSPWAAGVREYHQGAIVAFRGDGYDRLMILLSGSLSAELVDYDGRVLKIESLKAPEAVASGILFAEENQLPVQLTAETDIRTLQIPRHGILRLCRDHERFLGNYLRDMGDKVVFLAEKIRLLQFNTLRQKIAGFVLDLSSKQGSRNVRLPYTIEKVAEMFGVARPSLSRGFSELIEEGLLDRNGRDYIILDPDALEDLVTG